MSTNSLMKPKRNYKPGPNDDCQTPGYGVEPLIIGLPNALPLEILEPASGEGLLADALESKGHHVTRSDIKTGVDFLTLESRLPVPVVSNPPFSRKEEFMRQCYTIAPAWALLVQTETLSLKWFHELVETYSPEPGIISFSPRINFKMPNKGWAGNGAQFPTIWITWNMGFSGIRYVKITHWTKAYRQKFEV